MIVDGVKIAVTKNWILDVLKIRIEVNRLNIEDLFLVTHAPTEQYEGDSFIETEYGSLRVFWRNDLPKDKIAQILHKARCEYPKKGQRFEPMRQTTREVHSKIELLKVYTPPPVQDGKNISAEIMRDADQVFDELTKENWKNTSGYDGNGDLIN